MLPHIVRPAINPDRIDALAVRLMTVLNSDPASALEATAALFTVVTTFVANQRALCVAKEP
jgi:hypothetical protein